MYDFVLSSIVPIVCCATIVCGPPSFPKRFCLSVLDSGLFVKEIPGISDSCVSSASATWVDRGRDRW